MFCTILMMLVNRINKRVEMVLDLAMVSVAGVIEFQFRSSIGSEQRTGDDCHRC